MKNYPVNKIRNVGVFSHGGAGKTSLVEAMLFDTGATTRLGKVDDGTTTTDYFPEEIKRKITVNAAMAPVEWRDNKINLIDTPGFADFIGDVKGAMRVVDAALFVFDAVAGVEVMSEILWDFTMEKKLPKVAFINKMDRENANYYRTVEMMKGTYQENLIIPLHLPIGSEGSFSGVVDILKQKAYKFEGTKHIEIPVPGDLADQVVSYREALVEAAAEGDDEIMMKYLDGETLTAEEVLIGFRAGVISGKLVPVLCGSALKNIGAQTMMDVIVDFLPSPADASAGKNIESEPLAALVFKTIADPFVGKVSYFRVVGGVLKSDSTVFNANKEIDEKLGTLFYMRGKNQDNTTEVRAGDIGAVAKLQATGTGDTLCVKTKPVILPGIEFPEPTLSFAVEPKSKGDEDKLGHGLHRLLEEDPTLRLTKNTETKETILTAMGETHLDITVERLHRKFGVEVVTKIPKVPFRETIRSAVKVEGKHKKQSGGHGQFGHVWLELSPLPDHDFEFAEHVFGGSVPRNYFPAVEKGVREAMVEGPLAGYPVTNIKVNLYDGSYHPVDSSEMSFKIAAVMAFRKGTEQAKPVLLEPVMNVEVIVPEQFMGDIISDLNGKRGRVLGMESSGKSQIVRATVPLAEMYRYAIDLKSITQGRGNFKMEYAHYEEVPGRIIDEIVKQAQAAKAAEK